ncbi:DUF4350 domain-containing protein [Glaciihabitans sp. INWT7]|uniref:DUF4350 domain-containing protein n=1 Tax=Glaciihabitans sp. INWT7 TaxID=2596912 RepID=UPI00162A337E|nr:DUF4350 domain-containing protein [Glaciihabitans sp. INWT7]
MTATATATATATTVTPTIRVATRRSLFWIVAAVFLILIAVIALAATGASSGGVPFSATNAAPAGSKAIAEVLRQQGVDVSVPATLSGAKSALRRSAGSTLFLFDPDGNLDKAQLRTLAALAQRFVVLSPTYAQVSALAPEVGLAGIVSRSSLAAGCDLPAARAAGRVSGAGSGFRVLDPAAETTACFASGKRTFSVVDIVRDGRHITVVGTTDAFDNEHVSERGNAALALSLLGQSDRLVWYLPTIDDSSISGPSIAQLTPAWVGGVSALLVVVAIAAAFWRGRRLGPLVVENLPVVVRASETMEGRARLYQKGAARLRALDSLRIGSVSRLAILCGLPRLATVDDVIAAVARVTARDPAEISGLLLTAEPRNDRELVRLSDELLDLERTVARDIRPS